MSRLQPFWKHFETRPRVWQDIFENSQHARVYFASHELLLHNILSYRSQWHSALPDQRLRRCWEPAGHLQRWLCQARRRCLRLSSDLEARAKSTKSRLVVLVILLQPPVPLVACRPAWLLPPREGQTFKDKCVLHGARFHIHEDDCGSQSRSKNTKRDNTPSRRVAPDAPLTPNTGGLWTILSHGR